MNNMIEIIQNLGRIIGKKSYEVFTAIKPHLIQEFNSLLESQRTDKRGRKKGINLNLFFEAMFIMCDNNLKMCHLKKCCGIAKSTYFKILSDNQFFEKINETVINQFRPKETIAYVICDSMTVKSMDGIGSESN